MDRNGLIGPSRRRAGEPAVLRAVRALLLLLYGFHVAVGALLFPASAVVGVVTGLTAYWIVVSVRRQAPEDFPRLPHPALVAAVTGCLPAALSGTSATGAWGALAVGLLVVETAVLFARWIHSYRPATSTPALGDEHGQRARDESFLRQVLTTMPTEVLLDEWEATQGRLTAAGGDPLRDVRLRDLLIDELRDRDPVGTARWLRDGPADLPDLYIRPDPDPGH